MDQQTSQQTPTSTDEVEAMIRQLERQMPDLQMRHGSIFALANAWAERHDAVISAAPKEDRPGIQARLARIGIRWGVVPGARVTRQFPALAAVPGLLRRKA